jgi:hypothetical protein
MMGDGTEAVVGEGIEEVEPEEDQNNENSRRNLES